MGEAWALARETRPMKNADEGSQISQAARRLINRRVDRFPAGPQVINLTHDPRARLSC